MVGGAAARSEFGQEREQQRRRFLMGGREISPDTGLPLPKTPPTQLACKVLGRGVVPSGRLLFGDGAGMNDYDDEPRYTRQEIEQQALRIALIGAFAPITVLVVVWFLMRLFG